jgi:hypothetical protein
VRAKEAGAAGDQNSFAHGGILPVGAASAAIFFRLFANKFAPCM